MRANTGYGPIHVRAELGTHGLDSAAIAAAMDSYEGDWQENARDLVRRRFGEAGPQDLAQRRKRRSAGPTGLRRRQHPPRDPLRPG